MPKAGQTVKPLVKLGRSAEDCWTWLGPKTPAGHGKKTYCGEDMLAHRWIWEMLFGPIPPGFVVYATCGRMGCTNPHHLACGYMADAQRSSCQTKLLPSDVIDIRAAKKTATHATAGILAERYSVSPQTIRDIWANRSWRRRRLHRAPNQQEQAQ